MCSYSDLTRLLLFPMILFVVADAHADELLPPPIPVLRIGESNAVPESVPARRVEMAPEIIKEKYPNRKVKIERQVVQDDERNYVNHGPWKMWDPEGRLVAHGEFRFGKQHGSWVRLMSAFGAQDNAFQPPFMSQAEFANGKLHGTWTVSDSRQRLVGSWEFEHGVLHGKTTNWYASGQPQQEMTYQDGKLDGEANTFTAQGTVASREFYRDGRQLIPVVTWHEPKEQKQAEGWTQTSEVTVNTTIDWWQGLLEISREPPADEPVRVGEWTEWHANGTKRFTGTFRAGRPVGTHAWWHDNGQKQLYGSYEGGQRVERWTRWHANGRKEEEGGFIAGTKNGVWKVWTDEGQLIDERQIAAAQDKTEMELTDADPAYNELVPARPVSIEPHTP